MPQNDLVKGFEQSTGRASTDGPDTTVADFEASRGGSGNGGRTPVLRPSEINAALPKDAAPVGQRSMTPAEKEMTATAPKAIGPHGEIVPTGPHPLAATINPVTKQPFPGQTRPNTPAQNLTLARDAAPWAAAAIPALLGQPEMSMPVRAGTTAVLAGGIKGAMQFFDPDRPDSAKMRGLDILKKGAEVGGTELAGELAKAGGGAFLRRYFPNIADAIEQGTTKFLHAVPSNDINVRENYHVAQGDLQAIAREMLQSRTPLGIENPGSGVFSHKAPGGIVSTELRPTELYEHIQDYLKRMYSDERQWQIMQAGGQQLTVNPPRAAKFDPQIFGDAMRRVARIPDPEEGAHLIAARVAANPTAPLTVEEADILERATSTMLRKFQSGTGSKMAVDLGTQRNTALMAHADEMLNDSLNTSLQGAGLPGINTYARRYAALARVMDNLEKMIPATERGRLGLKPMDVASPNKVGRAVVTMIGQNPGREIEDAMRVLVRAPDIPRPTGTLITPLPGNPGPVVGGAGAGGAVPIPRPAGPAPAPAGPPLNMGQPPTLMPGAQVQGAGAGAGAGASAGAGAGPMGMPPPPPMVPTEAPYATINSLRTMRARALAAGADEATLANMDRRIAEMDDRIKDVGPPSGESERRASRLGGMPKIEFGTQKMGDMNVKYAQLGKIKVYYPATMSDEEIMQQAHADIAKQAAGRGDTVKMHNQGPDDFAF